MTLNGILNAAACPMIALLLAAGCSGTPTTQTPADAAASAPKVTKEKGSATQMETPEEDPFKVIENGSPAKGEQKK